MRNKAIAAVAVLLVMTMGIANSLRSQDSPAKPWDPDHAKHSLAVNLLRAINTAEANYKTQHGVYASRDVLLTSEEFKGRSFAVAQVQLPQFVTRSGGPEIPPGWSLRLNVTADGKAYDVLLEDTTDNACGYAAVTDERGVIRQSKVIDCPI
jgi:hypothetical protein